MQLGSPHHAPAGPPQASDPNDHPRLGLGPLVGTSQTHALNIHYTCLSGVSRQLVSLRRQRFTGQRLLPGPTRATSPIISSSNLNSHTSRNGSSLLPFSTTFGFGQI